jgi:hypothetical protein
MGTSTAGTNGWRYFGMSNDKMEASAFMVDHVRYFVIWNVKDLCDSI